MAFKYKLKEAPSYNLAQQTGAKIGDVSYSKDGKTKFVVNSIDKETGQIGWKVISLPAFEKLNDDIDALVATAKGVYTKTKDDEKFREFYEESRLLRNKIRKHLRNEYPEEYKRMTMEGEVKEATGESGDVVDLTPSNLVKLNDYIKTPSQLAAALLDLKDEIVGKESEAAVLDSQVKQALDILKKVAEKEVKETSTSGAAGSYLTKYAFKKKKVEENIGATLGPGPKAGPDGVKDNYYIKKFKYKLVPKDKNGNYVQKGSGLEVKNF